MNLNKTILVNQGQAMITEAINTSQPIILTKFTIGKGTVATENAALALTNVVLSHRDVAIANNTQEGNVYKCTCYYDNKTEPADVTIKEIGLYGKVGASGTVKLFAYVTFEPGDYLPIGGGSVYSEYSKILNVGITELATVQSVVNIIVENATKTSLGVVQIGNGVAVNTNGVISLGTTNDGLIINASDIKLDTQNTLTSTSITKPLSANMGKQLQDTKANGTTQVIAGNGLTGGGDLTTSRTLNIVSANDGIVVNADNIELKPATTSIIGGVKPDGTTITVDAVGKITTAEKWKSKNNYIPTGLDANDIFENGEFQLTLASQTTPPSISIGSQFFLTCRMTKETNSGYGIQCAYSYNSAPNADVMAYRTYNGGPKSWGSWRYLVDKVIGDETYVKKAGDTMTGALNGTTATFSGNVTAPRLTMTSAQATGAGDAVRYDFANSTYFTNNPKTIPENTNLNTFLTKGHYTSVDDAITATMFNTPFGILSFTLVVDGIQDNNMYISQLATNYYGTIAQRITQDAGITWTPWTEIINKTTGDATYVKKAGDTSTGAQRIRQQAGVYDETGFYIDATNAQYPRLEIFKHEPTAGQPDFYIRRRTSDLTLLDLIKCTHAGLVSYAGGNYGTINGSTATFSGNVTAPSITIGGYVVTIV